MWQEQSGARIIAPVRPADASAVTVGTWPTKSPACVLT